MKILKRTLSAFLAVLMCIPSGVLTTVNASEINSGGYYTVMLADSENGILQFSERCMESSTASQEGYNMIRVGDDGSMNQVENDGSIWAFKEGDKVKVEAIPIEGYHVESFSVSLPFLFSKRIRPSVCAVAISQPERIFFPSFFFLGNVQDSVQNICHVNGKSFQVFLSCEFSGRPALLPAAWKPSTALFLFFFPLARVLKSGQGRA